MYEVYVTESFQKIYDESQRDEKNWIDKIKDALRENPLGKILKYYWFMEKKFNEKRLFFVVNENKKKVLLVSFAPKKDQQKTINTLLKNMDAYLDFLNNN